jgi:hypothetical protein
MSDRRSGIGWGITLACLWLAACGESTRLPATAVPQAIEPQAIVGDWYNTETGIYPNPSIAMVRFYPAGGIVMTGIDDSAQYGQYTLLPDGRLRIRMALSNHARLTVADEPSAALARTQLRAQPAQVIYDAIPMLDGQNLALQVPDKRLVFSRGEDAKARVMAATLVFSRAREAERKAEEERQRLLAEQRRRDNLRRVQTVLGIKTVLPVIGGAGAAQCAKAVLAELRRVGWKVTQDKDQADAVLDVHLSAIQHKTSAWIGRYYKMTYAVKIRRAADQRMMAAFDGAERAAGQGTYETCTDTADDIVDEIEDLIDDLRD